MNARSGVIRSRRDAAFTQASFYAFDPYRAVYHRVRGVSGIADRHEQIPVFAVFGNCLTMLHVPDMAATAITSISSDPIVIAILLNLILLVLGMIMDHRQDLRPLRFHDHAGEPPAGRLHEKRDRGLYRKGPALRQCLP